MKEGKVSIEYDTLEQFEEFKKKAEKAGYVVEKEKIHYMDIRNYFITFTLKKVNK